ncbi:MAG: metal-dependent transcriptional regulator [Cyclobacteriaceae bacterium]
MLSFAEENYLKAIYHLSESGRQSVSTNALSEEMKTKPASVSDMIKKLADKNVISYRKYQGVNISASGKKEALKVIRKHRLWEVFLVEKLKFNWDEVHVIAEQLEHIKSPLLTNRLDEFLGFPRIDPHGDPIPDEHGNFSNSPKYLLTDVELDKQVIVVGVENSDSTFLKHLDKLKISLGTKIVVKEKNEFDGLMLVELSGENQAHISGKVAENLLVTE